MENKQLKEMIDKIKTSLNEIKTENIELKKENKEIKEKIEGIMFDRIKQKIIVAI